jgi:hypothetical protein
MMGRKRLALGEIGQIALIFEHLLVKGELQEPANRAQRGFGVGHQDFVLHL